MTVGNLGTVQASAAMIDVAATWVKPGLLRLDSSDALTLVAALKDRDAGRAALKRSAAVQRAERTLAEYRALAPARLEGYAIPAFLALTQRDEGRVRALIEALKAANIDRSQLEADRAAELAGENDEESISELSRHLERLALHEAEAKKHAATFATLQYLIADALLSRARIVRDVGDVEKALARLDKAERAWSGLDVAGQKIRAHLLKAALETYREDQEFAKAWDADNRRLGMTGFLVQLKDKDALRAALAARPDTKAAAELIAAQDAEQLGVYTYSIATIAGHQGALAKSREALSDPFTRLDLEFEIAMNPLDEGRALSLKVLDSSK